MKLSSFKIFKILNTDDSIRLTIQDPNESSLIEFRIKGSSEFFKVLDFLSNPKNFKNKNWLNNEYLFGGLSVSYSEGNLSALATDRNDLAQIVFLFSSKKEFDKFKIRGDSSLKSFPRTP